MNGREFDYDVLVKPLEARMMRSILPLRLACVRVEQHRLRDAVAGQAIRPVRRRALSGAGARLTCGHRGRGCIDQGWSTLEALRLKDNDRFTAPDAAAP